MRVSIKAIGAGKTTDCIIEAAKTFSYIVCFNRAEAERVYQQAKALNLDIPFPLTAQEFFEGRFYNKGIKGFIIDNLDLILIQYAKGVPIQTITFSEDEP